MGFGWLVARPIAHRGLHDRVAGRPENTIAAARAAVAGSYAVECDVQASLDGEAMVFHDAALGRLTGQTGPVAARTAAALGALPVAGSAETIPTLPALLSEIAGRVPLIVEIKSGRSGDLVLTRRVAEIVSAYGGPVAVKSFDPTIVAALRGLVPGTVPRGIVGETTQDDPAYAPLSDSARRGLSDLLHIEDTRPDFVSWRVDDLPCAAAHLARVLGRLPVMAWTVRTDAQVRRAAMHADQMVFEGFAA